MRKAVKSPFKCGIMPYLWHHNCFPSPWSCCRKPSSNIHKSDGILPLCMIKRRPCQNEAINDWQSAFATQYSGGILIQKPSYARSMNHLDLRANLFGQYPNFSPAVSRKRLALAARRSTDRWSWRPMDYSTSCKGDDNSLLFLKYLYFLIHL